MLSKPKNSAVNFCFEYVNEGGDTTCLEYVLVGGLGFCFE
jgi:hypothetical protein